MERETGADIDILETEDRLSDEPEPREDDATEADNQDKDQDQRNKKADEKAADQDGDAGDGEGTDDQAEDTTDAEPDPPKRRRPGKAARKISRLEAENRELRERMARLEGRQDVAPAPKQTDEPEPREQDFADRDEFLVAKAEHRALKRLRAEQAESRKQETERTEQSRQAELQAAHARRIEAARDNHDDYDKVVSAAAEVTVTDTMGQAILESEQGAELVYHLAKNPDEARRIAALPRTSQARELGKIEARLEPAETPKPPKKTTAAPNPPSRVKSTGTTTKSPETMTQDEYNAWRMAR